MCVSTAFSQLRIEKTRHGKSKAIIRAAITSRVLSTGGVVLLAHSLTQKCMRTTRQIVYPVRRTASYTHTHTVSVGGLLSCGSHRHGFHGDAPCRDVRAFQEACFRLVMEMTLRYCARYLRHGVLSRSLVFGAVARHP